MTIYFEYEARRVVYSIRYIDRYWDTVSKYLAACTTNGVVVKELHPSFMKDTIGRRVVIFDK